VLGTAAVVAALVALLLPRRDEFETAVHAAPMWLLLLVAALQLIALLARTEAWHACIRSAGGAVARRRVYRASGVGGAASLVNAQLAVGARVAILRRASPREAPRVPALIAAELPILTVEAALAAVASFTLVGPLGLPWWVPLACFAAVLAVGTVLRALARSRDRGFWRGIAIMRTARAGVPMLLLVLVAVFAQIARNWLVLHALGVDVSVFDATALLIAIVTLSQLPVGPSVGAAAAVVVLGPHGVATVAAAGVLLTVTGTVGSLSFAGWALFDQLRESARYRRLAARYAQLRPRPRQAAARQLLAAMSALDQGHVRLVEVAYFGGLSRVQIGRTLNVQTA
jgi:uncharacterized membrane protein YbhN (UPF0104 family)